MEYWIQEGWQSSVSCHKALHTQTDSQKLQVNIEPAGTTPYNTHTKRHYVSLPPKFQG